MPFGDGKEVIGGVMSGDDEKSNNLNEFFLNIKHYIIA